MSTYLLPSNASTQAVFAALSALSTTTTTTSPSQNNATPQVKKLEKNNCRNNNNKHDNTITIRGTFLMTGTRPDVSQIKCFLLLT